MVLTITVVGNGQGASNNAGHAVLSSNDLAQLMSGQAVTGLLNPDGSITLNSNVLPGQSLATVPTSIPNGSTSLPYNSPNMSNSTSQYQLSSPQSSNLSSVAPTMTTCTASSTTTTTTSNQSATTTANENRSISGNISNLMCPIQTSTLPTVAITTTTPTITTTGPTSAPTNQKKTGQKRLTAKQKQQNQKLQQQQQQQQQIKMEPQIQMQSPITRTNTINAQAPDQTLGHSHQIVATVQLPNGQIGQLIAPSGGQFWSPNAINLQQLSMAVAAATGTMPQMLSIPPGQAILSNQNSHHDQQHQQQEPVSSNGTQMIQNNTHPSHQQQQTQDSQSLDISGQQQQQVMTNVQLAGGNNGTVNTRQANTGNSQAIWPGGPISLNQLSALAQQGVVQVGPGQAIAATGPNGQHIMEVIPQGAIQGLLGPGNQPVQAISLAAGGQFIAQDPNDPTKWQLLQSTPIGQPGTQNVLPQSSQQNQNQIVTNANGQLVSTYESTGRNCNSFNSFPPFTSSQTPNPADSRPITSINCTPTTNTSANSSNNDNEISGASNGASQRKLKRLACTCPNCRDGDNIRNPGDKKQHICHFPDCNKVYGKTSHLRAHLRWHSGERPYVCNWSFCGKKFTRSDELQRHRRTHTGEKRFQCSECLKRFMRSDHLSKHLKTHLSSKKLKRDEQTAVTE